MLDVHQQLRESTRTLHAQLDALPPMRHLLRPDLGEAEYAEVLRMLNTWLHHHAPHLSGLTLPDYAQIDHKFTALARDLKALGRPVDHYPRAICALNRPFALGVHYVIEGSFMGARVLAPKIEAALQRSDITHFYRLYGGNTLANWQQTLATLESELQSPEALQQACDGAREAFNAMISQISEQMYSSRTSLKSG